MMIIVLIIAINVIFFTMIFGDLLEELEEKENQIKKIEQADYGEDKEE